MTGKVDGDGEQSTAELTLVRSRVCKSNFWGQYQYICSVYWTTVCCYHILGEFLLDDDKNRKFRNEGWLKGMCM